MGHNLFIYGTLENPEIQERIFGRIPQSVPDALREYKRSQIKIDGENFPCLVPIDLRQSSGLFVLSFPRRRESSSTNKVDGAVIEITNDELEKIDDYETNAYKRKRVILESGLSAWMYIEA